MTPPQIVPRKRRKAKMWGWIIIGLAALLIVGVSCSGPRSAPATLPTADKVSVANPAVGSGSPILNGPAAAATVAAAPAAPAVTTSQRNAVDKANDYLAYSPFSKSGLVKQLTYEGFSAADANYAVGHITVNWTEQADKKAKDYMAYSSFSRASLIKQLTYEGFSASDAAHGATSVGL